MFRRSFLQLSSKRISREIFASQPRRLYSRNRFSTAAPNSGNLPESKSNLPKVLVGSAVVGGAGFLAYKLGYLDHYIGEEWPGYGDSDKVGVDYGDVKGTRDLGEKMGAVSSEEVPRKLSFDVDQHAGKVGGEEKVETRVDVPHVDAEEKVESLKDVPRVEDAQNVEARMGDPAQGESMPSVEETADVTVEKGTIDVEEKHEVEFSRSVNSEGASGIDSQESKTAGETNEGVQVTEVQTTVKVVPGENEQKSVLSKHITVEDKSELAHGKGVEVESLLDSYFLEEKAEERTASDGTSEQVAALVSAVGELNDGKGKEVILIGDFLEAIHQAEKRQAELDARLFALEKRNMKEKYEKELRDLRARELMRTEEAAMLDKELKRERAKAAAAIRAVEEKMLEKLKMELEQKENETEMKLQKSQELAKAQLAAAIASEKAAQIEKIVEANRNIDALCLAFFAQSEQTRQIDSVHKLALGALALEDALSKGLPIQKELDTLNAYLQGIDNDSLLHLVLSTLPEETRHHGTDTLLQLNHKFNSLKRMLRHDILIPPGGGGILAHALAHVASWLRIKEVDPSGDGIESVISRVESLLAEGKLAEAADALQEGVQGSQAEEKAGDWVRRAKNRAITEQALMVLQSYATSISLTQ